MTGRLRHLIVLMLIAAQAVTIISVLAVRHRQNAGDADRRAREVMAASVDRTVDTLRWDMRDAERVTGELSLVFGARGLRTRLFPAIARAEVAAMVTNPEINTLHMAATDGRFVVTRRAGDVLVVATRHPGSAGATETTYSTTGRRLTPARRATDPDYRPTRRPWFRDAMRAGGRQTWTEPHVSHYIGEASVASARSFRVRGGPDFVIATQLGLSHLSGLMRGVPGTTSGTAFVLDDGGSVVALQAADARGFAVRDAGGDRVARLTELPGAVAEQRAAQSVAHAAIPTSTPVITRVAMPGGDRLVAARTMELTGGAHWTAVTQAPVAQLNAGLASSSRDTWIILGVSTAACLLAALVLVTATRPLEGLQRRATLDALTGIPNRSELMRLGTRSAALAREHGEPLAVVALDLDGFKAVNDTYGHGEGDIVLRLFAQRIRAGLRPDDLVGRLGGDEFIVVLRHVRPADAGDVVVRLLQTATSQPVHTANAVHEIRATAGVEALDAGHDFAAMVERADQALIAGKASAKGRPHLASSSRAAVHADV